MALSASLRNPERWTRRTPDRTGQVLLGNGIRALFLGYMAAVITLHIATVPTMFELRSQPCGPDFCFWGQMSEGSLDWMAHRGISATVYGAVATFIPLMIPVLGHALAALVVWQRPTDWLPLLFTWAIAICTIGASGTMYILAIDSPGWERAMPYLDLPFAIAWPLMPVLFPTGRFVPRWGAIMLAFVAIELVFRFNAEVYEWMPVLVLDLFSLAMVAIGLIAMIWRLHVTDDRRTRRQTQVFLVGILPIWIYTFIAFALAHSGRSLGREGSLLSAVDQFVWGIGILVFLLGFLLAIYLYNVYDLSFVIRRSIVYGTLIVLLTALYLLTVATVSAFARSADSAIPAILATVVIALAFAPLRNWLQRRVRRLLYGDESDPYGVLTRFGQHLEEAPAPERLLLSVIELAQDALRVPAVALSVAGAPNLSVRTGDPGGGAVAIPVRYQGDTMGLLEIAPRGPVDVFSPADRRLIIEIARQTGIAVHSTLLSESLKQSREQIVTAREEERRRIRNDLHDGLGPALAALSLQVEIARDLIVTDPDRSARLLEDVLGQTRESILDIRRLVYDLRPPALDDLGLVGAIRSQVARWESAAMRIRLDLPETVPPLTAATEVAIYRIAQESLANVARHSGATEAWVHLTVEHHVIRLEVSDNGAGLPTDAEAGVGLRSMRDRAAELGGRCVVTRGPNGGVTVTAEFALTPERGAGDE